MSVRSGGAANSVRWRWWRLAIDGRVEVARAPSPTRAGGTISSRAFWEVVDRLQIPDVDALELIGYPGKIGTSGKRPRFRLSTRQTRLVSYLHEIESALQAIDQTPAWLRRRNRVAPFSGQAPIDWLTARGGDGLAEVLQFLNRAVLRKSLE